MSVLRATLLTLCLAAGPAHAQLPEQAVRAYEGVGLLPRLGERIPLDLVFADEEGASVALQSFFAAERPVLLTFVYHTCPMLCSALLDGLTRAMATVPWTPGDAYEMVTISINSSDTPALARQQRDRYLARLGDAEASWHFLTGEDAAIRALTSAVGFHFQWVEDQQEYAHPAAIIFLSGDGTLTRYLPDITPEGRDIRAALVEASEGSVGSILDRAFLYCFQYDPARNSYALSATRAMRVGGLAMAFVLIASLSLLWRREFKRKRLIPRA